MQTDDALKKVEGVHPEEPDILDETSVREAIASLSTEELRSLKYFSMSCCGSLQWTAEDLSS